VLLLPFLAGACETSHTEATKSLFGQPVAVHTGSLAEMAPERPTTRPTWEDLEIGDGIIQRVLWVQTGQGEILKRVLERFPEANPAEPTHKVRVQVEKDFFVDAALPVAGRPGTPVLDAFFVSGPRDMVDRLTGYLAAIQRSVPQIEIESRIVEVRESDEAGIGVSTLFTDVGPPGLIRAETPLSLPQLPGTGQAGVSEAFPLFVEFGAINKSVDMDFVIMALRAVGKTDVLSAPVIACLSGFHAEINAGQEVPYFTQTYLGTAIGVSTSFKKVFIRLIVTPVLVASDLIRINLETSVENVSDIATVISAGSTLVNPIVSVRSAKTTVDVRDGDTVMVGGLITQSKVILEDRVPLLGDIPLLNFFFSSKRTQDVRTNLIFFIKPRVITSSGEAGGRIIIPAGPDSK
jgi:type II secretory pathway component GspD/PulD (secretin)